MSEHRVYSLLTITKADEQRREISGVMSTGETDRVGDQVMPMGVKARLPAPCLWQHDHRDPIGEIVWIEPKPDGIRFKAKLLRVDDPPSLKEKLDGYFALIKAGVVKGISVGFRALEVEAIATGLRFKSWELLEASVVTIPANAACSIQTVKALDAAARRGEAPATQQAQGPLWDRLARIGRAAMDEVEAGADFKKLGQFGPQVSAARSGQEMIKALANHVDSLEARLTESPLQYRGVWQAGQSYPARTFITFSGSVWFTSKATSRRPGEGVDWILAVRKGQDAK